MGRVYSTRNIIDMQDMPIWRILFKLSWPVALSMLMQSLYNFIDSIYLSRLGDEVLSSVSLAFTVQNFVSVFFVGIATGMNVVISRALGSGDFRKAKDAMFTACVIQFAFSAILFTASFWFVPFYYKTCSANGAVIMHGIKYLLPCMIFAIFSSFQILFERLLQSSGLSKYMLFCQFLGSGVNILLDPILIFGFGTMKGYGVAGAAYATLTGQLVSAVAAIVLNFKYNSLLFDEKIRGRRFSWSLAGSICYIGIPSSAVGLASSISGFFINKILIGFSATANASFGIYAKLENMVVVPAQGLSAGLVTLLSFFVGKKDFGRLRKAFLVGEFAISSWMIPCALLFIITPGIPLSPFSLSNEMLELTIPAVQIVGSTYILSGFMIGLSSFYQAIGKSIYSLIVVASRQLFVRIPIAFLLASFSSVSLIWWCWPISEIVSDTVNICVFRHLYKRTRKQLTTSDL